MYNVVNNNTTQLVGNRTIINLNGTWFVGESIGADEKPAVYDHTAPIPGLLTGAQPEFKDLGKFESRGHQYNKIMVKQVSAGQVTPQIDEEAKAHYAGKAYQDRNYFWYKRTFLASKARQYATLVVLKVRFGSAIWVNGEKVGESDSCFTSEKYDISDIIRWDEENEIIIRIGAHPGVLPEGNTCMTDVETEMWYPGIWDDVELYCYDNPVICSVQIAPKVEPKQILVETEIENLKDVEEEITLKHQVKTKELKTIIAEHKETITLAAGEKSKYQCIIELPDVKLWTPEDPNLYILDTSTGGDSELNRFGVREFNFKASTKRAYLNNDVYFLRGSLICLGRFFEDPLCGQLPWDEAWVRSLLGDSRRKMGWNVTKYCIHDVPRKWLDISDDVGLMAIPELGIWAFNPEKPEIFYGMKVEYNREWLLSDMKTWISDMWNHPSVIYFSAALETCVEWMGDEMIPEVRKTDLSNRAWNNSYSVPSGPDDPLEDHPYEFQMNGFPKEWGLPRFDMIALENKTGHERQSAIGTPGVPTGHAQVLSEYGWLWVTRGGQPTNLLKTVYPNLPYPVDTPQERIETACYLAAGLTEYWRAHRNYAQVMNDFWLAGDMGEGHAYTVDYFENPVTLKFHPGYTKYAAEAFKPLGVYLEMWQRELKIGEERIFYVMLVNDYPEEKKGDVIITMEYEDDNVEIARKPFVMTANGNATVKFIVNMPEKEGKGTMSATAVTEDGLKTISRRWLELKTEEVQEVVVGDVQYGQSNINNKVEV